MHDECIVNCIYFRKHYKYGLVLHEIRQHRTESCDSKCQFNTASDTYRFVKMFNNEFYHCQHMSLGTRFITLVGTKLTSLTLVF